MDWKEKLTRTTHLLNEYRKDHADVGKGFTALHQGTMAEGALSVKHKELQAVALGIAARCDECIGYHMKSALRAGASREEVMETIGVAVMMGGGPAYMYAAHAFESYQDLSA